MRNKQPQPLNEVLSFVRAEASEAFAFVSLDKLPRDSIHSQSIDPSTENFYTHAGWHEKNNNSKTTKLLVVMHFEISLWWPQTYDWALNVGIRRCNNKESHGTLVFQCLCQTEPSVFLQDNQDSNQMRGFEATKLLSNCVDPLRASPISSLNSSVSAEFSRSLSQVLGMVFASKLYHLSTLHHAVSTPFVDGTTLRQMYLPKKMDCAGVESFLFTKCNAKRFSTQTFCFAVQRKPCRIRADIPFWLAVVWLPSCFPCDDNKRSRAWCNCGCDVPAVGHIYDGTLVYTTCQQVSAALESLFDKKGIKFENVNFYFTFTVVTCVVMLVFHFHLLHFVSAMLQIVKCLFLFLCSRVFTHTQNSSFFALCESNSIRNWDTCKIIALIKSILPQQPGQNIQIFRYKTIQMQKESKFCLSRSCTSMTPDLKAPWSDPLWVIDRVGPPTRARFEKSWVFSVRGNGVVRDKVQRFFTLVSHHHTIPPDWECWRFIEPGTGWWSNPVDDSKKIWPWSLEISLFWHCQHPTVSFTDGRLSNMWIKVPFDTT